MAEEPLEPLSPFASELIGHERHRGGPSDAAIERLLARVNATTAAVASPAPAASTPSTPAASLGGKLAVAVVSGVIGAAAMGLVQRAQLDELRGRLEAVERDLVEARAPKPELALQSPAPSIEPTPAPVPAPAAKRERVTALSAEAVLLERARTGLLRGDPAAALVALEQHAATHPRGQLAEEREALAVQALVSLGRVDEARQRAAAFRAKYPSSLLSPAVEAALQSAP